MKNTYKLNKPYIVWPK